MAKKIKFPLQMKKDTQVRDLDELREHFDLDKAIGYFLDGKLLSWLEARYYDTEADAVRALNKDDADVHRRLCEIFGAEYHAEEAPKIDVEAVEERNRRLGELKQYTSDPAVLEKVDQVAFNQEELADLIDEGYSDIYLCNNSFVIPLRVRNKHYIGIGKAEAVIRSHERVDFEELGIRFDDVKFDEAYEKLKSRPKTPEELYQEGKYQEAAAQGHSASMFAIGYSRELSGEYQDALQWYIKAAETGNVDAMFKLGTIYGDFHSPYNGWNVNDLTSGKTALYWYTKAAEHDHIESMIILGEYYGQHHISQKYTIARAGWPSENEKWVAKKWYERAAELGSMEAITELVDRLTLSTWSGNQYKYFCSRDERIKWTRKGVELGNVYMNMRLGDIYLGKGDANSAIYWYEKYIELVRNQQLSLDTRYAQSRIDQLAIVK